MQVRSVSRSGSFVNFRNSQPLPYVSGYLTPQIGTFCISICFAQICAEAPYVSIMLIYITMFCWKKANEFTDFPENFTFAYTIPSNQHNFHTISGHDSLTTNEFNHRERIL
jgi:hypothetical protein